MAYLLLTPVPVSLVGEVEVGFYRLWKASGKGGDNWYRSLGPKQAAVFNHQTYTHEKPDECMHIPTQKNTLSFHFLWFLQPSCCFLSALDAFISLALYRSPLMKGSM